MALTSHPSWLRRLSERLLGRPKAKRKQARRHTAPLAVERLEERTLLTGTWTGLANPVPSANGTSTMLLLSDGSVMVNGGGPGGFTSSTGGNPSSDWYKLTPDNTGNYADGTWTKLASMNVQRLFYTSDVLPDGRVLVVGGEYSNAGGETNTGEIYDPTTNTWTNIPNVTTPAHPITTFGDGPSEVLADGTVLFGYNGGSQTYIYNPTTNKWSDGPSLLHGDTSAEEGWVKLADGSILTYSIQGTPNDIGQRFVPGATPALDKWVDAGAVPVQLESNGGAPIVPENGPPVLLPDGRVFYIGASGHTALYTPGTNSWVAGPDIPNPDGNPNGYGAFDAPAAILPNGKVLVTASPIDGNNFPGPTFIFQYDPATNAFTQVPAATGLDLSGPAFEDRFLMLPNGQALFSNSTDDLFAYTPDSPQVAAGQATVSTIVRSGGNFTLTGTQLNGISEGATYGDDAEMASNYPILSFTDGLGNVAYGRTFNWSSVGVQTGAAPVTTQFSLPPSDGTGAYLVNVDANGLINAGTLLLDMGNGFNNVTIRIDPTTLEVQTLENGNPTGLFPRGSFTSIIVLGDTTNDTLSLDFTNGNFIPSGGLNFDGMTGNNTLNLLGFSPFTNEVVTPTSANSGTAVFDGSTTITFAHVRTLDDTTAISGKVTYNGRLGGQTINVTNFGPLNGVQATQIASSAAAFPTIVFSQKPSVLFQGAVGGDTFNLNDSIRAKGLNTQTFAAGSAAGNSFNIPSTPAGVVTNVVGGAAGDSVTVSSAGSVQAIAGTLNIENTGGLNALLVLDDSADAGARTVTLSSFTPNVNDFESNSNDVWGKVNGLAPADINYEFADTSGLTIDGGAHGNTFVVNTTTPGQTTTINAGAGNDSITVKGVGANSTDDINGQAGNDTFAVTAALPSGATLNLDGGTGANTLTGTNLGDTYNVTGTNSGNDAGVVTSFANIQGLFGGTGADTFNFVSGSVVTANGGAGDDTFNLTGGSVTSVDGGTGNNTLTGPNAANSWNVTGANSGNLNGTTAFTNIENLTGGSGADTFTFGANGSLLGNIDGGGLRPESDSLNISAVTGAGFNVTGPGTAHGYAGTATVLGGFNNIDLFTGSDTLIGSNTNNVWTITGPGSGTLVENGTFTYNFSGIAHLIGGSLNDQFIIAGGSVATIDGGAGNNTITGDATANTWDITGTNSGTLNTIAFSNIANLVGGPLTDQFNVQGGTVTSIDGGAGTNTLTGDNIANTWNVTGLDAGSLNGMTFQHVSQLVGGSAADQFNVTAGGVASIDGGAGNNTLAGPNTAEVWNVTGANAGNLPGLVPSFVNIQNLVGGTGNDDFVFSNGATLSGAVDGGAGNDTLNVSAYMTATNAALTGLGPIDGYAGNVTGVTGFTDLETLIGGPAAGATLTGLNGAATWAIGGAGSYTINGSGRNFAFSGITNLTGGAGADDFVFAPGATFAGAIDGGGGTDTLDFSAYTTPLNITLTGLGATDGFAGTPAAITGGFTDIDNIIGSATATPQTLTGTNLNAVWSVGVGGADGYAASGHTLTFSNFQDLTGGSGNDNFVVAAGATFAGVLDGGAGTNTLTGPNQNATWNVTGANTGNIAGGVVASFQNIQNLTGGTANDDFVFSNAATLSGTVDGGAGADTLNLSAYLTAQNALLTGTGAIDGFAGSVGALTTAFTDIDTLIGSATAAPQTLTGANLAAGWNIGVGGADTYTASGLTLHFSSYQNLTGGANVDSFVVATGATFPGAIDGGGGANTLTGPNQNAVWDLIGTDAGDIQGVVGSFQNILEVIGGSGNDDFIVHAGAALMGGIDGGGGDNTLTGPNQNEVWGVTGVNSGYLSGVPLSVPQHPEPRGRLGQRRLRFRQRRVGERRPRRRRRRQRPGPVGRPLGRERRADRPGRHPRLRGRRGRRRRVHQHRRHRRQQFRRPHRPERERGLGDRRLQQLLGGRPRPHLHGVRDRIRRPGGGLLRRHRRGVPDRRSTAAAAPTRSTSPTWPASRRR